MTKFLIKREDLLKPLQSCIGVVERRQTIPILANLLVQVTRDRLGFLATDLEVQLTASTTVFQCSFPGEFTVSARKLFDICRALPEETDIEISLGRDSRLTISCGASRYHLATMPAAEYPRLDEVAAAATYFLPKDDFLQALTGAEFSMAHQDVRYFLNGMLFELKGNALALAATDGHRLALTRTGSVDGTVHTRAIVPRKGVSEILRLLQASTDASVQVDVGKHHLRVTMGDASVVTKLIDGEFPDYNSVIPQKTSHAFSIPRAHLRQALMRVSILCHDKLRSIRFCLANNEMRLLANNPEQETAEEILSVPYEGVSIETGFNVNYLLEALAAISSEEVDWQFNDAEGAFILKPTSGYEALYVVMPMRL